MTEKEDTVMETILRETEPLSEKMVYETSKQLFDTSKILMICDLNTDQINYFFKLILIDKLFYQHYTTKHKQKFKNLFENLLQLTISKNRQSRSEIVEMFKILRVEAIETEKKKGLLRR